MWLWSTTVISRASCSGSSQPLPRPAASQPDACVAPHRSSELLLSVVVSARLCHVSASKYRKVSPQFQRTWVKFPPVYGMPVTGVRVVTSSHIFAKNTGVGVAVVKAGTLRDTQRGDGHGAVGSAYCVAVGAKCE